MSDPKTQQVAPSVAVILVNYNGYDDTVECVQSLCRITYGNYKVFIVDNASADKERLRSDTFLNAHAEIIYAAENGGFSAGNNIAIEKAVAAGFDYVLLLNNDTTVEPDFLDLLVAAAEAEPNAGIVSGKMVFYGDRSKVWYGGGWFNKTRAMSHHVVCDNNDDRAYVSEMTFVAGCLMLVPRKVIETVGLLPEDYFLYCEDTAYCCNIMAGGYKLLYCNSAVIYHKVSASTNPQGKRMSPMQQYYLTRNSLYMIKRYSSNKPIAYLRHLYTSIHLAFIGQHDFRYVYVGYRDFLLGRKGKGQF